MCGTDRSMDVLIQYELQAASGLLICAVAGLSSQIGWYNVPFTCSICNDVV